jgi:hypothetical protein
MQWLRSAALLFETVTSFVPAQSKDDLTKEIREFQEATQGAWTAYTPPPREKTNDFAKVPIDRLDHAFNAIATHRSKNSQHPKVARDGSFLPMGYVLMHPDKLSDDVLKSLNHHKLLKELSVNYEGVDWRVVNEQASDIILSCIADRIASKQREYGWFSITDSADCYTFNAFEQVDPREEPNKVEGELARLLVTGLIPDLIKAVPIAEYCEIRNRYELIREELSDFLKDLINKNRLTGIEDVALLEKAMHGCVAALREEIFKFIESPFGRRFKKWSSFAISGFINIAATPCKPHIAIPLQCASVAVASLGMTDRFGPKVTKRGDMVKLLASARSDIIEASPVERFLIP